MAGTLGAFTWGRELMLARRRGPGGPHGRRVGDSAHGVPLCPTGHSRGILARVEICALSLHGKLARAFPGASSGALVGPDNRV